ncbi:MAG: phosphoadenosine phosphosulfate reductase family protein, partial [Anaerolineales bacterium]|nr:phosphoadenosine phosphosulfate reductase family protein [Anaerolineales bacterium]
MNASNEQEPAVRHILSLSGGKDSTALAIYLHDRIPELEYVFCDTEQELPETYDYLGRLEAFLGKRIHYLKHDGKGFDELLTTRRGFLPSPQVRWCTDYLKIKPFEKFVGDDVVHNYIGIRADE